MAFAGPSQETMARMVETYPQVADKPVFTDYRGMLDAVEVDAILGRDEVCVPPECGLRVIALTEAVWKFAALGRVVQVAELV